MVSLRDSANAPRRLAVVKGPAAGRGGHVLLEMGQEMHVAVRRESICVRMWVWGWVLCVLVITEMTEITRCGVRASRRCCLRNLRAQRTQLASTRRRARPPR